MSLVLQANTDDASPQGAGSIPLDGDPSSSDTAVSSSSPSTQTTLNGDESPELSDFGDLGLTPLRDEKLPLQPGDEYFIAGYIRVRDPELPHPWTRPPYPAQAVPATIMLPPKKPFRSPYPGKPFREWPVAPRRRKSSASHQSAPKRMKLASASGLNDQRSPRPAPAPDPAPVEDTSHQVPPNSPRPTYAALGSDHTIAPFAPLLLSMDDEDDIEENDDSIHLPSLFPPLLDEQEKLRAFTTELESADFDMSDDIDSEEEEDTPIPTDMLRRCRSPAPSEETNKIRKQNQRAWKLEVKRSYRAQDARMKKARELFKAQSRDVGPAMELKPTPHDEEVATPVDIASSEKPAKTIPEWISSKFRTLAEYAEVIDADNNDQYTLKDDSAEPENGITAPCGCCET